MPAKLSLRQLTERGERPFPAHPQVGRYFPAAAIENARRRMTRAIDRGDGPGLVIGAAGTGKSLFLQVLAAQFHERFDVVLLACARLCTRRALLQAILFELDLPYRLRDEGQLRFGLLDYLLSGKQTPSELLLLVDEAQALPITLLDELRMLTNLVHGGSQRVRLVLAGSGALEESFASPELESFSQRLAARCYLTPLSREETAQFVRAQLSACGAEADSILLSEACQAVFEATDGVPRLVNQLCDRAISLAVAENCSRIDRPVIQTAWSDLQQLPSPWEGPPAAAAPSSNVVEFGGLSAEEPRETFRVHPTALDLGDVELDIDEVRPARHTELNAESGPPIKTDVSEAPANPFAEPFAEEEVVLDNFASWSDMFDPSTPRVENLRDQRFTSLIHEALGTTAEHAGNATDIDLPAAEERTDEADLRWPPLRIAALPDANLSAPPADDSADDAADDAAGIEAPILIVEDDPSQDDYAAASAAIRPQIRRQEYRRLFSRLRSG
jgi:type II secretory pathway predicted ATPase ExeA